MIAGGSRKPYKEEFSKLVKKMELSITAEGTLTNPVEGKTPAVKDDWSFAPVKYNPSKLFAVNEVDDNKRRNPVIYKVLDDDKHLRAHVLRGGYISYEIDNGKATVFKEGRAAPGGAAQGGPGADGRLSQTM